MSNKKFKKSAGWLVWLVVLVVGLLLAALAAAVFFGSRRQAADVPSQPYEAVTTEPVQIQIPEDVNINLGYGLEITDAGSYTGIYMEDGTDDTVSGTAMIVVTNTSDQALQYAGITVSAGERTLEFSVSTLPAGESVLLLEAGRQEYVQGETFASAVAHEVVFFDEPLSLCEDQLEISALDGAMNVTNISGQDITGDITIYYKNASADLYYGGITYRARIEGGLAAGEIKQIMTEHFSASGSEVVFVTAG